MGKPNAPGVAEETSRLMEAMAMTVPGVLQMASAATPGQEMLSARTALKTLPIQQQITEQQARTLAGLGREFEREDVANRADILRGEGADFITSLNKLNQQSDPEFYRTRAETADNISRLFNSINVDGLSGGEMEAIERSVNRDNVGTGNLGVASPTKTIQNALQFGREGQAFEGVKKNQLTQAINAATAFLPSAKQNTDANAAVFGGNPMKPTSFAQTSQVGQPTKDLIGNVFGASNSRVSQNTSNMINAPSDAEAIMGSMPDY